LLFMSKRTQNRQALCISGSIWDFHFKRRPIKFDLMIVGLFLSNDFPISQSWVWVWYNPLMKASGFSEYMQKVVHLRTFRPCISWLDWELSKVSVTWNGMAIPD
jgi:hypothetical protein